MPAPIVKNRHGFRFLGNDVLHQLESPEREDLAMAIQIIEDNLTSHTSWTTKRRACTAASHGRRALPRRASRAPKCRSFVAQAHTGSESGENTSQAHRYWRAPTSPRGVGAGRFPGTHGDHDRGPSTAHAVASRGPRTRALLSCGAAGIVRVVHHRTPLAGPGGPRTQGRAGRVPSPGRAQEGRSRTPDRTARSSVESPSEILWAWAGSVPDARSIVGCCATSSESTTYPGNRPPEDVQRRARHEPRRVAVRILSHRSVLTSASTMALRLAQPHAPEPHPPSRATRPHWTLLGGDRQRPVSFLLEPLHLLVGRIFTPVCGVDILPHVGWQTLKETTGGASSFRELASETVNKQTQDVGTAPRQRSRAVASRSGVPSSSSSGPESHPVGLASATELVNETDFSNELVRVNRGRPVRLSNGRWLPSTGC